MIEDQGSSSQNQGTILQGTEPDRQISPTPKEGKTEIAFCIAYVWIATGVITYAYIKYEEIDLCTLIMPQNQAGRETCDIKEKNKNYLVFIRFSLGVLGILLAPTVRCLCDIVAELCQSGRDRRIIFKLFKSCFSGVPWESIAVVFVIDTIACVLAKKSFNFGDLMYILGGIGLYPLVTYLLNLNEQSEIGLSRLLENLLEKLLVTCFKFFLFLIELSDLINDIYNIRPDESDRPKNMSILSVRSTNNLMAKAAPAWSEYKRRSIEERAFFEGHENRVERLPCSIFPIKENKKVFDRTYLPIDYRRLLIRLLGWIESFKIVNANKECNERHLEIVCKFGKVPRTADIANIFGEEILPFIAYQECSKTEWFETNILDENFEMIEKYKDELSSSSWVKNFYIGFDSELDRSWHIYITYAQNNAPSMVDLKKIFGVNILSFVDFIQESVDVVSKDSKREWFETNIIDKKSDMKEEYKDGLERLEWVESCKIVDANEECDARHLEIVCKLGEVPRTAEIVKLFGEEILPFITYKEGSKRVWFETNIFDENYTMEKGYKKKLTDLPWVKDFYIGVASEPEKSWQIYITYARDNAPSMVDLKKVFGVNIASFVDFIQDSEDDKEPLSPPRYLRGPRSGDKLCARPENEGGTIGILTADKKHYATTCYHSCFNADEPKNIRELSIPEIHELLMNDYENESLGCQGTVRVYTETPNDGQFRHGLYDDDHDIAIIELNWPGLNCIDAVNFLRQESIKPKLANNKEVADMFFKTGPLTVKKFGAITETTEGEFYAIDSAPLFGTTIEIPYRIKGIRGQTFAMEGDSGSLLYLEYDNERKPFGYLCSEVPQPDNSAVYGCRNLNHSMQALIKRSNLSDIQPCFNNNH